MNTTVATIEKPTKLDAYLGEVLPPDKKEQLFRALPRHIRAELFERNLANALMQNPDLLKCDPREVFKEVAQIAALGLMLDPQLGEAWLIAGYSTADRRHKPQRRIGYRGLMKLARQSGEIATLFARDVREHDLFAADLYKNDVQHTADVFSDRGKVIGFYAVARYRDGSEDWEPMSVREVETIRDRGSDSFKAWKAGKTQRLPIWETDFVEMGKKTVLRRLIKRLPQSPELAEALKVDLEEEAPAVAELSPPRGRPRLAAALAAAAAPPRMPQDEPPPPDVDRPADEPDEPQEPDEPPQDGMGYDTREEKRMDLDDGTAGAGWLNQEALDLYKTGANVAAAGARKIQFWLAKLPKERLDLLTESQQAALRVLGKQADAKAAANE